MSINGCNYLADEVEKALEYCRLEFDMTLAEAIGILHITISILEDEAKEISKRETDNGG